MQSIGALNSMRSMMDVLREVSLEELREQAELAPRLLIVGPSADGARLLAEAIVGPEGGFATDVRTGDEPFDALGRIDAAIVWDPARTGAGSRVAEALRFESPSPPIIRFEARDADDREAVEQLRGEMLKRIPDRAPAFGRALPEFRATAAKQIIDETAVANAQFSFVSTVPTLLPIIGNLAAASADFIVLTKNQVMMLYKLAAAFGRDLTDHREILAEAISVVGAGLVWRTLARQATNWLPFAAGLAPKLAISYAGTIAVGRAAEYYYRTGVRPSRQLLEHFVQQAVEKVGRLNLSIKRVKPGDWNDGTRSADMPTVTILEQDDAARKTGAGWRE